MPAYTLTPSSTLTMTHTRNSNVQLLATLVDLMDEEESEYRFLIDGKHVKYVTVDPGVLPRDDRAFAPILLATLPPFPPGDWNEGHISKNPLNGELAFSRSETTAYEWIDGQGIGPKFLGHLTEDGRVIGLVLEFLDDTRSAEIEDLTACQTALTKLHSLGIKHGDINKYNFLIREGKAVLVDFEAARKCSEEKELQAEYERLERSLRDASRRGATYT
ncbi:hypothetical protein MAC_08502 [Metarhizium acridum CQMa 102]|uniref:Alpha-galactosidase A n=1 Tax=Metarhizium acridum (strain CQMa 102) TaxID=655827 RepID=E9EF54_METAQ|nr:uncharacterized protein MAC_08502 [Metarhizium acridum CQMa 102]EFY85437.1 hypothetical protein MAC_08502 [Metarhizium acridum CQMa 102]